MNDLRCLLFRMNTPSLGALTSTIGMSGFHKNSVSVPARRNGRPPLFGGASGAVARGMPSAATGRMMERSDTTRGSLGGSPGGSLRARLVRQIPMRLLDVSLSGCLVESASEIPQGATGTLNVDLWGVPCRFPVRLSRQASADRTKPVFRLGVEFAWRTWNGTGSSAQLTKTAAPRGPARILPFVRP